MTAWALARAYDPSGEVNLAGFSGSMATYGAGVAGLLALGRLAGYELPERYALRDLLVGGIATHKFSRLLSKGSVTSPLRSPFTEFSESAGPAEHHESVRGTHGLRHTIGELLSCPFCLGVWIGTAYVAGLVAAPRATRTWAAVFAVVAVSDGLQHAYERLRVH
jgi:Protein of unknown function (DUF1360)